MKKILLSLFVTLLIVMFAMLVEHFVYSQFGIHVGIGVGVGTGVMVGSLISDK